MNTDTAALVQWDKDHLIHGFVSVDQFAKNGSLIISEAQGTRVKDINGKEYIDAMSGAVSVNVGYGREEMAKAAMDQMLRHSFSPSYGGFASLASVEFAHRLAGFTPNGLKRFFFTNSGSESNEAAFKVAIIYWAAKGKPSKQKIISRFHSYHGLTLGAMSATGIEQFWVKPMAPHVFHIAAPYCYRCAYGKEYPGCSIECAYALEEAIEREGEDNVAAFIGEPVYGATGCIPPVPEYWPKIREICTRHDVLLIADEVITGFGRTGKNFALEHWNVTPDLMTMAKGITSGALPCGGLAITEEVFQPLIQPGILPVVFTTGAHPVSMAVAMKNLEIIIKEKLVENAARMGGYLLERLGELRESPHVGEVRGLGLMTAFELVKDKSTRTPFDTDGQVQYKLILACREKGLIVRGFIDAIMVAPALIATTSDIDDIMDILKPAVFNLASCK